jgi:hypothetical protein
MDSIKMSASNIKGLFIYSIFIGDGHIVTSRKSLWNKQWWMFSFMSAESLGSRLFLQLPYRNPDEC